jgi:segregation and condensation protein B
MGMELKLLVEAILFAAQKPLALKDIKSILAQPQDLEQNEFARAFKKTKEPEISKAIQELKADYAELKRSFQIQEVAGAFQLISQPEFAPWLKQLFTEHRSNRLSQPALETLAIIAYRQPITRADIEVVRGVAVDGVMQTLLERGLVTITGRAEVPGRPMLYGTTKLFLEHFGLNDLNEMPAVEELRKINLRTAEAKPSDSEAPANEQETLEPAQAPQAN